VTPALRDVDADDDAIAPEAKFSVSDQWDRTVLRAAATATVEEVGAWLAGGESCRRRPEGRR